MSTSRSSEDWKVLHRVAMELFQDGSIHPGCCHRTATADVVRYLHALHHEHRGLLVVLDGLNVYRAAVKRMAAQGGVGW